MQRVLPYLVNDLIYYLYNQRMFGRNFHISLYTKMSFPVYCTEKMKKTKSYSLSHKKMK